MEINKKLIKDWIQYLKNNQIVSIKSDPSGKLNYKRPVTVSDVSRFLQNSGMADEKKIASTIESVLQKRQSTTPAQDTNSNAPALSNNQKQLPAPTQEVPIKPDFSSSEDEQSELSQTPDAIRKRKRRAEIAAQKKVGKQTFSQMANHLKGRNLQESFEDEKDEELSEQEIEEIFGMLSSLQNPEGEEKPKKEPTPDEVNAKKIEDVRKLKRTIRDVMTPTQRKQLWRELNDTLQESQITSADAKAVFKTASEYKPSGLSFWRSSPKVSFEDLMKAWKDAGYPDDTRDLEYILKNHFKFQDSDINKVFQKVFGKSNSGSYNKPESSEAVTKIVKYIKDNNLQNEIITFMKAEFENELEPTKSGWLNRGTTNEEINEIFYLLSEGLDKNLEIAHLGRNKKG